MIYSSLLYFVYNVRPINCLLTLSQPPLPTAGFALHYIILNLNNMASSAKRPRTQSPEDENKGNQKGLYAKSYSRVSKHNLYMIIALWMEDFVDAKAPKDHRKVGAVLVLPNDVIFAADCSRLDGVHAVARLLMKHCDKAKGCKMFMSRKPCPICAKLLVQSKVERVLFLPREPEYYRSPKVIKPDADEKAREEINNINDDNNTQMKQVDNMFTASVIAQTRFVLQVEKQVLADSVVKSGKTLAEIEKQIKKDKGKLMKTYDFKPEWIGSIEIIKKNLPWPAFDEDVQAEVLKYFDNVMEWMARAIALPSRELNFEPAIKKTETTDGRDDDDAIDPVKNPTHAKQANHNTFDPVKNHTHAEQARHFMSIARFLAQRTDDPTTGVGAVIVSREMEILSFGWNGFPLKALYGEFPRASSKDDKSSKTEKPVGSDKSGEKKEPVKKKYPYVIHAEQNALLFRNNKNIKDAILFVTRTPCDECAPLIFMQGIETFVVDDDVFARDATQKGALKYEEFTRKIKTDKSGKFVCFQTREPEADPGPSKGRKDLFNPDI
ncbi:cytidine and dCMP deaminase domain-containing 1-like [Paramuricea clavata]|uniref:Cytidine and dCMP deaminase domain-containing protein 1 n=1 Tax=Paramuricea clavata TaxID=317549 RepID=A0A7D9DBA1_PARCT|nr:cytidine and dCMP deaminase domain-containing 1-like [Paramuricea clavata]